MRYLLRALQCLWLNIALLQSSAVLAQSDLPSDKVDESKALPLPVAAMEPPPSCYLWAEPNDTRTVDTEVNIKMETSGKVTSAILDTSDVETIGGVKKVKPYKPSMVPNLNGTSTPLEEKNTTYLASVAGPGGTAVCLIWISRTETLPKPPRCSIDPKEQTVKTGDTATIALKVDGDVKDLIINEKTEDATKRSFTFTPDRSRALVVSVGGTGGLTTCSALITLAPKS